MSRAGAAGGRRGPARLLIDDWGPPGPYGAAASGAAVRLRARGYARHDAEADRRLREA